MRAVVAGFLLLWLVAAAPVVAHGILEGSSPPANAVLLTPPKDVVLAFNEPVDPAYSTASVRDAAGGSHSSAARLSADGRRMVVELTDMAPGLYTVRWRVLSAVDGHTTAGTLLFAVGQGIPAPATSPGTSAPDPIVVAFRWVAFAAALVLVGALTFQVLVWRWSLRRIAAPMSTQFLEDGMLRLRRLAITSGGVFLVGAIGTFVAQGALLLDRPALDLLRPAVLFPLMSATRGGWSLLLFVAMTLIALIPATLRGRIIRFTALIWVMIVTGVIVILGGPPALSGEHIALILLVGTVYGLASILAAVILPKIPDLRIPEGAWVPVVAAALLPWGFTIASHAAAGGLPASGVDWLHLVAAAVWIGGLPSLLLVLGATPAEAREAVSKILVPRVSALAGLSLGVMVLTGAYSAWRDVAALRALVTTAYGRTLLWKLLLVAGVIALGAANRYLFRPRIEAGTDTGGVALRAFRRSVAAEVVLGALILLVVAVLTITPPAAEVTSSQPRAALTFAGLTDSYRVQLSISPSREGWNDFEATIRDEGAPQAVRTLSATLEVSSLQAGVATSAEMTPVLQGRYTAGGDYVRRPGWWEVAVTVRRNGGSPESVGFPLLIGDAQLPSDPPARQLLELSRLRMQAIRTWREDEQITDGRGHVTRTRFDFQVPDRLRYKMASGSQAVIIGAVRYSRERGETTWARDALPSPIDLDGPYADYFSGAENVRLGRQERCAGDLCQIVLWRVPTANASFAAWIDIRTHVLFRLQMVAPEHYMTSRAYDFNTPVNITPP